MSKADTTRLRLAALPRSAPRAVSWEPDAEQRARLAAEVGARSLRKVRLTGELTPQGRADWRLGATLGATAVQDCTVTLDPVTTRIDVELERLYVAGLPPDPAGETEMGPDADLVEPLPDTLDLAALVAEALALELPEFPRSEGAELEGARSAPPGAAPIEDGDRPKPFADLAAFRARMKDGG